MIEVKRAAQLMLSFNGLYEDLDHDGRYGQSRVLRSSVPGCKSPPKSSLIQASGTGGARLMQTGTLNIKPACSFERFKEAKPALPLQFDYLQGRDRDAVVCSNDPGNHR